MISNEQAKRMVGPGWGKIIDDFYRKVPPEAWIHSMKEKFGTLRIDGYNIPWETEEEAMKQSEVTCEFCGDPGETRDLPWILTLCDKHYKEKLDKQ
jgi:hypothetical protein